MTQAEWRIVLTVIAAGGLIGGISATALYFAFRAFGEEKSEKRPVTVIASLVAFLFACCALLFFVSRWR